MTAFKSVGLLRNNYFKISSNAPSNLLCNVLTSIFLFASVVFRCLLNDIALKGFLLQHCVVFLLYCVAIVISEPFFAGAYFQPDFAAIGLKKFSAQYFSFKAKLKPKKLIFK